MVNYNDTKQWYNFSALICGKRFNWSQDVNTSLENIDRHFEEYCHVPIFQKWQVVMALILMFLGLLFNGFILMTFIQLPRTRTLTNYFIASLALTDILIMLTVPIFYLLIFLEIFEYEFGQRLGICFELFCVMASLMNFACISVDRMIAISKPLYHRTLQPSRSLKIIVSIWFLAFTVVLLFGLTMGGDTEADLSRTILIFILFLSGYVFPTILTMVSYGIIAKVVLCSRRTISEGNHQQDSRIRQTIRITWKILLVIFPGFTLWGIFWIALILVEVTPVIYVSDTLVKAKDIIPILSATINPLIYVLMTTEFRSYLVRLIFRRNRTVIGASNTIAL